MNETLVSGSRLLRILCGDFWPNRNFKMTCDHPTIQGCPEHAKRPTERVLHQTGSSPASEMTIFEVRCDNRWWKLRTLSIASNCESFLRLVVLVTVLVEEMPKILKMKPRVTEVSGWVSWSKQPPWVVLRDKDLHWIAAQGGSSNSSNFNKGSVWLNAACIDLLHIGESSNILGTKAPARVLISGPKKANF